MDMLCFLDALSFWCLVSYKTVVTIFLNLIWSDGLPAQLDRWVQPWNSRKSLTIAKTWCCSDSEGFGASSHDFLISGVYTRVLCEGDL